MAIQMRRGANSDFNPSKMLPGEIAVTTDGTRKVYAAFKANDVKELASKEDVQGLINGFTSVVDREIAEAEQRIESKGQQVLETIPDLYEEVSARADEAVRTKADAIVCSVSGVNPIAKDSSNDYLRNLKLYGKTTQGENPSTSNPQPLESVGKWGNLCIENIKGYLNGTDKTLIVDGDGETFVFLAEKGKTYCFGSDASLIRKSIGYTDTYPSNTIGSTIPLYGMEDLTEQKFTSKHNAYVVIYASNTLNNEIAKTFRVHEGENLLPYFPYGHKVIESGVYGKNLLENNANTITLNGITFTVNDDGTVTANGTATSTAFLTIDTPVSLKAGKYIISDGANGGINYYMRIRNDASTFAQNNGGFTLAEDVTDYKVEIRVQSGTTLSNVTFYPMIRKAEITDGTYVPYTKQSHISLVGDGLKGIPVTDASLATYTDENGQMWCADYVDCDRGVLVQNTERVVLDGNASIISASRIIDDTIYISTKDYNEYRKGNLLLCDRLPYNDDIYSKGIEGISVQGTVDTWGIRFRLKTSRLSTLDIAGVLEYLTNNPMTVVCAITTPIITPLSASELASYKALKSNYKVTSVMNDCGAFTEVQYNADTKMYIDNKFAALAAQLV